MIQINNASVFLLSDGRALVRDISFTVNRGDRTVLIGEEGSGKSTLLALIADEAHIRDRAEFTGSISRGGHRIGYLPQELSAGEGKLCVRELILGRGEAQREEWRAEAIAAELGLDPSLVHEGRAVSTLSGGERVKLRLVKILLDEPDMLLLDEPTNDIDIETLEWLEEFIKRFDGGVLFVSHDETLIEAAATAVVHLEHIHHKKYCRHTVASVPYREYVSSRERAFLQQEREANKQRAEHEKKLERWQEIYEKVDKAQRDISRADPGGGRLLKKKMHSVMSQGRRIEREGESLMELPVSERQMLLSLPNVKMPRNKEILRLELPELTAPDGTRLTGAVKLEVDAAEHIAIIGRNGAGKTTLLRIIEGELAGRKDIRAFYMPQNYFERLDESMTPIEFLAPSLEKTAVTEARTLLGSVRFTAEEAERSVSRLSGGQKAKLFFVKMALEGCSVLILDEPTRNFSPLSSPVVRGLLRGFGGCIIAVSHDRKFIREAADRVYMLSERGLEETQL